MSFNFVAAVTVHSDFGTLENKIYFLIIRYRLALRSPLLLPPQSPAASTEIKEGKVQGTTYLWIRTHIQCLLHTVSSMLPPPQICFMPARLVSLLFHSGCLG